MADGSDLDVRDAAPRSVAEVEALLTGPGGPFEMATSEIGGRAMRSYVHAKPDLRSIFEESRRFGDAVFLHYEDERISFDAHWRAARVLAHRLAADLGVAKGDRVAVCMRNYPEWSVAAWATIALGAVLVPLNAWGTGEDIARQLDETGARILFADGERIERLKGAAKIASTVITVRAGVGPLSLEALIGPPAAWPELDVPELADPRIAPDDLATLFYSSGTTGRSRAALGTHRNITTNLVNTGVRAARAALRRGAALPLPPTARGCLLLGVPLFHVTGFNAVLIPALAAGSRVVLMYKWDVGEGARLIESERVTATTLVPTMWLQLLESGDAGVRDLSSLVTAGSGGAAAGASLFNRLRTRLPRASVGQGYGATETASLIAAICCEDLEQRPDSVGLPVPCCDIRIVDDDGFDVPAGVRGELLVRGPNVTAGYWPADGESSGADDGWYATGDLVRQDEEGFLYILDRKKDLIIRGGENIHCLEIEEALRAHEAIVDAAVLGRFHPILGEEVVAVVQLGEAAPQPLAGQIEAFLWDRLAAHKCPVAIDFQWEPLPRNAAGKVLKPLLRERMSR
ncbi:class I adenylate-forming enzyme family protein [Sphingopyxis fribergensis]